MRIYLDLVFVLNFLVDFLLLLGTNRLSGFPSDSKRLAGASVLGGAYACSCLLPGFSFLSSVLWRVVSLGGMAFIAFGWNRSSVKRCAVFILLSMALGGVALSLGRKSWQTLIPAALGMYLLCRFSFPEGIGDGNYVPLTLTYGGNQVELIGLRDTGNTLRDPVTGEQVLVISPAAAQKLTDLTAEQLRHPLETLAARVVPGLRLIPYHAVGTGAGMLLALRFEDVKIGNRQQSAVVAFAPEGLGRGNMVQALTGGTV